jgi:Mg/Co/Ni transporter MgtE
MATTEKIDPRAALAKMEAEEKAARDAADKLEADNEKKRKELLASLKEADLADVLEKIKLHGFTATDLRTALKKKGAKKATPRKSAPRKTTARKSTPRKKTA